ncbi:MAG TPA: DcaP family trimeric outer membrane transporter [Candidatus Margulisiibacteriota bacterium]|nr:DcaP family trimeric outer membrane transporter [Candidatus Margulisiibacteriota bacterium]
MTREFKSAIVVLALLCAPGFSGVARADSQQEEIEQLKKTLQQMQKTIDEQNKKIQEIEKKQAAAPPPATAAPAAAAEVTEPASPIEHRPALNDQQVPAPRPGDLAVDPKMRGFFPIPYTKVLMRLNAKPRVDFTYDPKNTGNNDRFVTAQIPVAGDPNEGGGPVFNANSKGSQLSLDVRAPEIAGSPRFYFQNDFFGSGSANFNFRVQHIYGKIYNVIVGETFGVFEDPDIWPDTVDYEGPNSMIFARIPLAHYQLPFAEKWLLEFGIEKPSSQVSDVFSANGTLVDTVTAVNHAPDGGFNLRWQDADVGHVQFATILRDIGARSTTLGDHSAFGWGANLAAVFNVLGRDSVLAQGTYGAGIGSLGNDTGFQNTDAGFDAHGNLVALPYIGAFAGYTHRWTDDWRSTATYGFVDLDTESTMGPGAYHQTDYASVNLVWQLRKRLSVGVEALYGHKETRSGAKGDVARTQVGLLYSIF